MISVIIPAYNAEATIERCIKSVLAQDYADFEVIVVDDGSTDDTFRICMRFPIVTIRTFYKGVSAARNRGIEEARGEYIVFLDADDCLVDKEALLRLTGHSEDLIISGYNEDTLDWWRIKLKTEQYLLSPNRNTEFAFVWGKLFKARIIKENNIRFNYLMEKHEDTEFVFHYLQHCEVVTFINEKTVLHTVSTSGKGMEIFNADFERMWLLQRISKLVNNSVLLSHCNISLMIVEIVRACRKGSFGEQYNFIRELFNGISLRDYIHVKGNSRIIPLLLKLRAYGLLVLICRIKAVKRYIPLIIFGAGATGRLLLEKCQEKGIRVECFCDEVIKDSFCGLAVFTINEAKIRFPDAKYMVTTGAVKDVAKKLGYKNIIYSKTVKLLRQLTAIGYDKFCLEICIEANQSYKKRYFIRSLDLIITERCSLRCQDCSNLMQYYKEPKDCDIERILKNLDILLHYAKIGEIRVIGGEPFMNKDWPILVEALSKNPKVKRIVIYTNGTIFPNIELLRDKKICLYITDYGKLSNERLWDFIGLLQKQSINHKVIKPEWTDCGEIKENHRTAEELDKMFLDCCSKNMTLSNGKLYHCAFAANLARLGISNNERACDFCNGRPFNAKKIIPAIQKENSV